MALYKDSNYIHSMKLSCNCVAVYDFKHLKQNKESAVQYHFYQKLTFIIEIGSGIAQRMPIILDI